MPKHRAGGKCTGSHTTVTDGAVVVVDVAQKSDLITKIVLGPITRASSRSRRLVFKEILAGWQVNVVDNVSIQTIFVYTAQKIEVRQLLFRAWPQS